MKIFATICGLIGFIVIMKASLWAITLSFLVGCIYLPYKFAFAKKTI